MATNEVFRDGNKLSLPVPNSTPSGAPVRIGTFSATTGVNLNGVTQTATDSSGGTGVSGNPTGYATVWLSGVFKLLISTNTAMAIGDPVYITSAGVLTPVSTSNALFGHLVGSTAKGTAPATLPVRLAN